MSAFPFYNLRQWHPTPVLLPGKSLGRRSLVGYSPWGCKESDRTEPLHFHAPPKAGWRGWESPWAPCAPSHGVGVGADSAPRIDGSVQAAMLKCHISIKMRGIAVIVMNALKGESEVA